MLTAIKPETKQIEAKLPAQCGQCFKFKPGQNPAKGICKWWQFRGVDAAVGGCDRACSYFVASVTTLEVRVEQLFEQGEEREAAIEQFPEGEQQEASEVWDELEDRFQEWQSQN